MSLKRRLLVLEEFSWGEKVAHIRGKGENKYLQKFNMEKT
jgi:hypothetical protein